MDGILIVNKTKGCTSHDIVYKIKKAFGEKVGHTGTLDPNATGVLPILVGKGTKLSKYLINHDKKYIATIQMGIKTDTADSEGKELQIVEVSEEIFIDKNKMENTLNTFKGKQKQTPPIYSAIKINGKKLYEYARKEEKIEIPTRQIYIYDIKLLNLDKINKTICIEVECSKGTYIRTLCENICERLGTIGYMKELNRTKVGEFCIEDSISIEELLENKEDAKFIENNLITIERLLQNCDNLQLQDIQIEKFLNGVKLEFKVKDGIYKIYNNNKFIGTGIVENNRLKRDVIIA